MTMLAAGIKVQATAKPQDCLILGIWLPWLNPKRLQSVHLPSSFPPPPPHPKSTMLQWNRKNTAGVKNGQLSRSNYVGTINLKANNTVLWTLHPVSQIQRCIQPIIAWSNQFLLQGGGTFDEWQSHNPPDWITSPDPQSRAVHEDLTLWFWFRNPNLATHAWIN